MRAFYSSARYGNSFVSIGRAKDLKYNHVELSVQNCGVIQIVWSSSVVVDGGRAA